MSERTKTDRPGRAWPLIATFAVLAILLFWTVYAVIQARGLADIEVENVTYAPHTEAAVLAAGGRLYPVEVRRPAGPPQVVVGEDPVTGATRLVSCTTCHATRVADPEHGRTKALDDFHGEIVFDHGAGALGCNACHDPSDYDSLRGADGRRIAYADVMQLCAQCHSRQHESYRHGAHGGMNGHWDLSRGPRTRNTCTDCHDPHAPAFPSMKPTFKPIDRGLQPDGSSDH